MANLDTGLDGKGTIAVDIRTNRSIRMLILHHIMQLFHSQIIKPGKAYPAGSVKLDAPKKARKRCDVKERVVEDIYVYDLLPLQAALQIGAEKQPKKKRLYYFAGGGWRSPPSSEHWDFCAELAIQLRDTAISVVSYPLAPNSPAPVSFPQIMKTCRKLLSDAQEADESVILAGDSAGGNLVLCVTIAILAEEEDAPCPSALMVISPSTDLRRENPDIKAIEKHDPILRIPFIDDTATQWRGDWDAADPRVTPLMADIAPLARRGVKVHAVVGRYDILSPDALLFRTKCEQTRVEGEWLDWDKQMHCFPLAFGFRLPESVEAKDWILDVLRRC